MLLGDGGRGAKYATYRPWTTLNTPAHVFAVEAVGFVARAISARDYENASAFIVQYLSLMHDLPPSIPHVCRANVFASLAPSFLAAACYVLFGRILWWVTPREHRTYRTLWCPPQRVSLFLVAFDLGSFLIQLLGAFSSAQAMQDKKLTEDERRDKREKGTTIMRIGLVLQVMCFVLFAVMGIRFLIVSRRWAGQALPYGDLHTMWKRLIWAVNVAATLILVGNVSCILVPRPLTLSPRCAPCTASSSSPSTVARLDTSSHKNGYSGSWKVCLCWVDCPISSVYAPWLTPF